MNVKQSIIDKERLFLLDDNELLSLIHQGDTMALDILIRKYKDFIRAKARTYFLIGADHEDIVQEGMIGLYKAILDYDEDKLSSFKGFAELCITRQIITAIKMATRQKHTPLNSYVSLDKPIYDAESERTLLDILTSTNTIDPQDLVINREKFGDLESRFSELLSRLERNVLYLYIEGCTYQEIAVELGRQVKSIDNAIQRIKRKLENILRTISLN